MNRISLNFRLDGKYTSILVKLRTTVSELYSIVRNRVPNASELNFYLVVYNDGGSTTLDENSSDTVEEAGLFHLATVDFCIMALGGSCRDLEPLPGYIEVTTSPCDVTYDDDIKINRAKMPCGCVIGPEAMKDYCNTIITGGKLVFSCPNCGSVWRLQWVRHVLSAIQTEDEMKAFSSKLNANFIAKEPKIQPCPHCKNYLERDPTVLFKNKNWVQCPRCTAKQGRPIEFCWVCLRPWKEGNELKCGNANCTGIDPRLQHLQACPTKQIGDVDGVPTVRCCVKCGTLIHHEDQCKHMACKCGYAFCFICLKPNTKKSANEAEFVYGWQCGDAYDPCEVAPRQQFIFEKGPPELDFSQNLEEPPDLDFSQNLEDEERDMEAEVFFEAYSTFETADFSDESLCRPQH